MVRRGFHSIAILLVACAGLYARDAHGQDRLRMTPVAGVVSSNRGDVSLKALAGQTFVGTSSRAGIALGTGAWPQIVHVGQGSAVVAAPDTASTLEDESVMIPVLQNDRVLSGEAPSLAGFTQPEYGTVVADDQAGAFIYTPNPNFHGTDAFTYTIRIASGDSASARVEVTVTPVNDPPEWVQVADTSVAVGVILAYELQATDVDGDSLAFYAVQMPEWLVLEGGEGGSLVVAGIASDADVGSYEVEIGVTDGAESATVVFRVNVTRKAPAAPVMVAPEDGAVGVALPVELTWEAPPGGDVFHVQVAADSGFTLMSLDSLGVVEPKIQVSELEPGAEYFWRVRAANEAGYGAWTTVRRFRTASFVSAEDASSPDRFALFQNYPNPFNPSTRIEFTLPRPAHVQVEVFDLLGRRVADLLRDDRPAGHFSIVFDASRLPAGTYVVRLQADGSVATRKITLLK